MELLLPRSLRRWGNYQSNLAKSIVFSQFQNRTKGQLTLAVRGDPVPYSFGYGKRLRAELTVENDNFFRRFLKSGALGFGESYVEGDWNSPDVANVIRWFFLNADPADTSIKPEREAGAFSQFKTGLRFIHSALSQIQPLSYGGNWATRYELERPFFSLMLDPLLYNSGAIFGKDDGLAEAQLRKQNRLARDLRIKSGSRILELGCGWGSFAIHLAQNFDCHVTAVTLSEEQYLYLKNRVADLGLKAKVQCLHADYRAIEGLYDRIVSIELIDTLDQAHLQEFFEKCDRWLKPQGIMVHQLLLTPEAFRDSPNGRNDWNQKYISPGIVAPTLSQALQAMSEKTSFSIRTFKDIGLSYSKTLAAWTQNFKANLVQAKALGFDDHFLRSWQYYLAYAEAAFDQGLLTAAQITSNRATQRGEEKKPSFDLNASPSPR